MNSSIRLPDISTSPAYAAVTRSARPGETPDEAAQKEMESVFRQFVGETFYQLMLKSLHKMHDKPAYMHGGQAETMFQGQLDQQIASRLAQSEIGSASQDLYRQFQAQLKKPSEA